jgi:hypothetical protein
LELIDFDTPFVPDISQLTGEEIPSKKEDEQYNWREI